MRYLHGLLIVGVLSLCCGILGSEEPSQSQIAAPALKSLEAERDRAVQRLATSQRDIEAERKALLAAIAKAQANLRQQQQDHDETVSKNRQLEQQVADARQAQQTRQIEVGRLARTLAGEGLAISSLAHADEILERWPELRSSISERLNNLRQSTRPSQRVDTLLDRSGQEVSVAVWQWGAAQRIALGDSTATRGMLLRLDDGFWQVAGPRIPDTIMANSMVADLTGHVTIDGSYDSGVTAVVARAGPFIWPILATALIGVLLTLDRLWLLWRWRVPRGAIEHILKQPCSPSPHQHFLQQYQHAPSVYLLERILHSAEQSADVRQHEAGAALVEAETRMQRGLRLLAVLAGAAPLLGLLGTVTGMISSFQALNLGQGNNAGELSAGIGEALLTTEFGLVVAVPLLIAHAIFARDAQRRRASAESLAMRLLAAQDRAAEGAAP